MFSSIEESSKSIVGTEKTDLQFLFNWGCSLNELCGFEFDGFIYKFAACAFFFSSEYSNNSLRLAYCF
jgi:hypothetical protein